MSHNVSERSGDGQPLPKKARTAYQMACDYASKAQEEMSKMHRLSEKELETLRERESKMFKKLATKDAECAELRMERDASKAGVTKMKEELSEKNMESISLRREVDRLRGETTEMKKELNEKDVESISLRGEVDRLHGEATKMKEDLGEKNAESISLRSDVHRLRCETTKMEEVLRKKLAESIALRIEVDELRAEGRKMKGGLLKKDSDSILLKGQLDSSRAEVTKMEGVLWMKDAESAGLRAEVARSRADMAKMKKELRERDEENMGLRQGVEKLMDAGMTKMKTDIQDLILRGGNSGNSHSSCAQHRRENDISVIGSKYVNQLVNEREIPQFRDLYAERLEFAAHVKERRASTNEPAVDEAIAQQSITSQPATTTPLVHPSSDNNYLRKGVSETSTTAYRGQATETSMPLETLSNLVITLLFDAPARRRRNQNAKTRTILCRICHETIGICPPNYPQIPDDKLRGALESHCASHPGALDIINGMTHDERKAMHSALAKGDEHKPLEITSTQSQIVYLLSNNKTRYNLLSSGGSPS